jgi:hypothetical protein
MAARKQKENVDLASFSLPLLFHPDPSLLDSATYIRGVLPPSGNVLTDTLF